MLYFNGCITEINNKQVNDAQDIDTVIPMYNLIEFSNAYSNTSGSFCQYYRYESALDDNGHINDFPANNSNNFSLRFKQQTTEQTGNGGTKKVERMVPSKYLSNF